VKKIKLKVLKYLVLITYIVVTVILPLIFSAFEASIIIITFHSSSFFLGIMWYWVGGNSILRKNGIRLISKEESLELQNYIFEMIENIELKVKIKIGILDDALPNAFTLFLNPKNYMIVFSIGIFENLDFNEIKAVVAHEMFHIKNRDVWIKSFFIIGRFVWFPMGPLLESYISRSREIQADLESSKFTKDPLSLASALLKMAKCYCLSPELDFKINKVSKSFWIINNTTKGNKNIIRKLLSRHPSIENRIKNLIHLEVF